jgi:very-short-patch-repair endonuclease
MESRAQVSKIFSYLRDIKKLDQKITRTINDYDKTIWLADFFESDGCNFHFDNDFADDWIVIRKQTIEIPPQPSNNVQTILDPATDIKNPEKTPKYLDASKINPDLKKEWDLWLANWMEWSNKVAKKYKTQKFYNELFDIYQTLNKEIGILDLVVGHGLLVWNKNNYQILHPLFLTKMHLIFDAKNGTFHIKPSSNQTFLEFNMFDNLDIPNREEIEKLKEIIAENDVDPRKFEDILPTLREIINFVSHEGTVKEELVSKLSIEYKISPTILNSPLLILRKQDARVWINEIDGIIQAINLGYSIPKTIEAITTNDKIIHDDQTTLMWQSVGDELLFPLSSNEEQKEIARRLSQNYGVVVQGPPGTGKSHTIVNLICHLLANGKKVLVTSHSDRALSVLMDKIPDEIRPLCLNISGNDIQSLKELEFSINKITYYLEKDASLLLKEITAIDHNLDLIRRKQAELTTELREISQMETQFSVDYENKKYKLEEISRFLLENESNSFIIYDKINLGQNCPLNEEEFRRLLRLMDNEREIQRVTKFCDLVNQIPTYEEISSLMMKFLEFQSKINETGIESLSGWNIPQGSSFEPYKALELIDSALLDLSQCKETWLQNLLVQCQENPKLRSLLSQTKAQADNWWSIFNSLRETIQFSKFSFSSNLSDEKTFEKFYRDFLPIFEEFQRNGNIGFMAKIKHRDSLYTLKECFIDNTSIDCLDKAKKVRYYLEYINHRNKLERLWIDFFKEFGGEPINLTTIEGIARFEQNLNVVDIILSWDKNNYKKIISSFCDINPPPSIDLKTVQGLLSVKKDVLAIQQLMQYTKTKENVENFNNLIFANEEFFKIFNKDFDVGLIIDAIREMDYSKVSAFLSFIYSSLNKISDFQKESIELLRLREELVHICPLFVHQLEQDSGKNILLTKYPNWTTSWHWNIFNNIFQNTHDTSIESIQDELQQLKKREKRSIGELVAKKTWHERILKTEDAQKRSLHAWLTAIKKIGKGKGKYVSVHRRTAQKELENCKGAIPVWIMSTQRVIETIKVTEKNLFDVIIFDESSQSDIFALCALFRAQKAVIVGDDKQISPEAVGKDVEKILELNKFYLKDIPHSGLFDVKTSLYDFGKMIFTSTLMLKEHFRCVPEIIQFSNDLSYGGAIVPLRYPKREEIFEPAVVAVRVKDGFRDDLNKINKPEAELLVDEIVRCCGDSKYNGMSIGIISLLGGQQALLIQTLLHEKLGEEEFIKRHIVCGDAYAFQGDERDLMFLSLVIAPNARFASLVKEDDHRRFNVASSRAKNRMWLFHSVDLEDIKNTECVRYKLLNYCINPGRVKKEIEKVDDLFESEFERDVFSLISSNGYAVTPQVKVGQYRIDLVVEGLRNRLAIECDGDSWHGVEKWEEDLERQQQLERVGWIFYRIRASEFYRDPHKATQPILKKIEEMGIEKGITQNLPIMS